MLAPPPRPSRRPPRRPRPAARLAAAAFLATALAACGDAGAPSSSGPPATASPPGPSTALPFVEAEVGLDFVHWNGMAGDYWMAEVTGSGAALFDADGDGDLDVYLVQGTMLSPGRTSAEAIFPPRHPEPLTDRLYRNELVPTGVLRFVDVTAQAGELGTGYGMGVASGDYDNDGRIDLYVTNFGSNQLLHNEGGLRFRDVTAQSGTDDRRWSVPAVFFDYDGDGWLDLYVGNYIAEDLVNRRICRDFAGALDYCGPGAYPPHADRLFHNRGDGTFEDVGRATGFAEKKGSALGAVATDLDGNGLLDLYVANDSQPNFLWLQEAPGRFREDGLVAGCAVNAAGKAEASMGVDAADPDRDGDFDLFMTHLTGESDTFYRNQGGGIFEDVTSAVGVGPPSLPFTSFGTGFLDYDRDGWLDLVVANGTVKKIEALARAKDPFPVHQPNQLFHGLAGGRFEDVTAQAGAPFVRSEVSRGLAVGDVDEDGDPDVLVANNSGPPRLLLAQAPADRPWLGLRLLRGEPARDALGARVDVDCADGSSRTLRVGTDGSFASARDPRLLLALEGCAPVAGIRVRWAEGDAERFAAAATGGYQTLARGHGTPLRPR